MYIQFFNYTNLSLSTKASVLLSITSFYIFLNKEKTGKSLYQLSVISAQPRTKMCTTAKINTNHQML